jgi:hypothetical protein
MEAKYYTPALLGPALAAATEPTACSSGGTSTGPGMIIPVVGIGVLTGFTRTFPAMLAFSLLLAVLSLFSFVSIRRTL